MVRKVVAWCFSFVLYALPCFADSQGSATGGTAGTQSTAAGCIFQTPALSATVPQAALSCDASGNLKIVVSPSPTVGVSTQSCAVACASTIVSGAHAVYGISGSATVTGTILVYDATSCAANGTVTPKKAFAYTVANAPIGVSWADSPMVNATGVAVCFSTTGPFTATASTTAFLSVDYK